MTIDPIAALGAAAPSAGARASDGGVAAGFGAWFDRQLTDANDKLVNADRMVQKLALGEADNLHQVMLALDEAKFSFDLLMQVRNKLLDAYQDVMRMQV